MRASFKTQSNSNKSNIINDINEDRWFISKNAIQLYNEWILEKKNINEGLV